MNNAIGLVAESGGPVDNYADLMSMSEMSMGLMKRVPGMVMRILYSLL